MRDPTGPESRVAKSPSGRSEGKKKGDVLSWVLLESYMDEHKRGMGHEGAGLPCRYLHGGVV